MISLIVDCLLSRSSCRWESQHNENTQSKQRPFWWLIVSYRDQTVAEKINTKITHNQHNDQFDCWLLVIMVKLLLRKSTPWCHTIETMIIFIVDCLLSWSNGWENQHNINTQSTQWSFWLLVVCCHYRTVAEKINAILTHNQHHDRVDCWSLVITIKRLPKKSTQW